MERFDSPWTDPRESWYWTFLTKFSIYPNFRYTQTKIPESLPDDLFTFMTTSITTVNIGFLATVVTCEETDGRTDTTKLIVTFWNCFANARTNLFTDLNADTDERRD
jgi:hypothetical protein